MKSALPSRRCRGLLTGGIPALFVAAWQPAQAQGVTLYGFVDAAITTTRNGAPGASTIRGLSSGVYSASRWGIRGSEDLGDGLKALFVLEAGFDLDTGSAKSFSGNPSTATATAPNGTPGTGFNRRSVVGLESSRYGTLTLGRDYTPFFYAGLQADIFRYGLFGNLQATVPVAGGAERWARVSNAVFYVSPAFNGVTARAAYSLGSESGGGAAGSLPRRANRFVGVGAEYKHGGLILTASYQELEIPVVAGTPASFTGATATRRDALLGARYSFGNYAVSGGYWTIGKPQNASDAWLGASMNVGVGTVLGQVQRLRQDDPAGSERKGTVLGVAYVHNLSKRTAAYLSYGQVSNNATGSFGLMSSDTSVTAGGRGADPKGLALGVRHVF